MRASTHKSYFSNLNIKYGVYLHNPNNITFIVGDTVLWFAGKVKGIISITKYQKTSYWLQKL